MSKPRILGLGAVAVLIAVALALPRLVSGDRGPRSDDSPAASASEALEVRVIELRPHRLTELFSTTGTVRANEQVDLVSEVAGVVEKILFKEGTAVERGQMLVKIDDEELQAQRDRVEHRLRLAESREARQRELREQGVVSEQDYDVARNELNVLRADLRLIEAQIEKTSIRAPFAGIVGLRYVSQGSLVSAQTRIATLQDLDPVKIDFSLPEKYAGVIRTGTEVSFEVEGSDRRYEAEIYAVEPRVDAETRSLVIRARTPNPGRRLLPGAFADVSLAIGDVRDALAVPSLAVIPELGGKKVFVVEEGRAQPRRVETGIRTDTEVQITAGLEPGDRVIVSAVQRLRPGLLVVAAPAESGTATP